MRRAAAFLARARAELLEGDDRERLSAAAEAFRAALARRPAWPAEAQQAADRLRAVLLSVGPAEMAVARLDDETLRSVSDELWRLCDEFAADYEFAEPRDSALAVA